MKKNIFLLISCFFALASCKKSGDGLSNTLMIGEVYRNGHLDAELIYAADKRLIRYNEYSVHDNQSVMGLYSLYEYGPGGQVAKRKVLTSGDTLNNYYLLTYDNSDQLSRFDWYIFGSELAEYRLFEYDQQGRISKYTTKSGKYHTDKNYSEFTYDEQGRLTNQKHYTWNTDKFYLSSNVDFTPAGKNVYVHWKKFKMNPSDFWIGELNAESRHTVNFKSDGEVLADVLETGTNRQYNGAGYLIKQTVTKTYNKPAFETEVRSMEYVYVQ
jgi:hypothetical protein